MILFEYFLMHSGLVLITNENEFELILNSEGDLVEILEKLDGYQECKTKREIEDDKDIKCIKSVICNGKFNDLIKAFLSNLIPEGYKLCHKEGSFYILNEDRDGYEKCTDEEIKLFNDSLLWMYIKEILQIQKEML